MTGALFLEELAEALRTAARRLEQGDVRHRAWATHLLSDRRDILLMALTWREPVPAEGGEVITE